MGNRIFRILHLAVMVLALVALAVIVVLQVMEGPDTSMDKLYVGIFVLLMIWAAVRVHALAKDLRGK